MYIKYCKIRESADPPFRAHPSDAGMDVSYCVGGELKGNKFELSPDGTENITVNPGGNVIIPTGLKFEVPSGYALMVCNRSSVAAKRRLVYGAHVIDSGYSGEVFIDLHNIGSEPAVIKPKEKIAQLALIPVSLVSLIETKDENELYASSATLNQTRGSGALGSTDKK